MSLLSRLLTALPAIVDGVARAVTHHARRYRRTPPDPETEARYERVSRHNPRDARALTPVCLYCGVAITPDNHAEHCPGPRT